VAFGVFFLLPDDTHLLFRVSRRVQAERRALRDRSRALLARTEGARRGAVWVERDLIHSKDTPTTAFDDSFNVNNLPLYLLLLRSVRSFGRLSTCACPDPPPSVHGIVQRSPLLAPNQNIFNLQVMVPPFRMTCSTTDVYPYRAGPLKCWAFR
jgi:hypothetical protein